MDVVYNSTLVPDEIDNVLDCKILSWYRAIGDSDVLTSSMVYGLCTIYIICGKIHIIPDDTAVYILGENYMRRKEWK